jgi:hypothetical protein
MCNDRRRGEPHTEQLIRDHPLPDRHEPAAVPA